MNAILIPVRINLPMTQACIASALSQSIPVEVWVVDNGSPDCGPWLRSQPLNLIERAAPQGLSRLWNVMLSFLFRDHDHVLVINNDIELHPAAYESLLATGLPFVTGIGVSDHSLMHGPNPQSRSPHPDFSCFLIHRSVWECIGPFDEEMVNYASDGDYHLRMDRAGIAATACDIPFFHHVSGTLKSLPMAERDAVCLQADTDRATFRRKWGFDIGSDEYYKQFRTARDNRYSRKGRL